MLKEIPLRGTNRATTDLAVEEAVTGAAGAEAFVSEELEA